MIPISSPATELKSTSQPRSDQHVLPQSANTAAASCELEPSCDSTDLAAWWISLLGSAAVDSRPEEKASNSGTCDDDCESTDLKQSNPDSHVHRRSRHRKQRAAGCPLPTSASRLPASHLPKTLHAAIIFHGLLISKEKLVKILVHGEKFTNRCRALPDPRRAVLLETPAIGVHGKEEKCWLAKAVVVFQPSYCTQTTSSNSSSCGEKADDLCEDPHAWPISDVREVCPPVPIPRQFGPVTWIKISRAEVAAVARASCRFLIHRLESL